MRAPFRTLTALLALALAPKCALCVLAYLGVGAATFGSVEMCSAKDDAALLTALPWLGAFGGGLLLLVVGFLSAKERKERRE